MRLPPIPRLSVVIAALVLASAPSVLAGQAADPAAAITAQSVRARVEALAHDSARGRPTPSAELEKAAVYVAHAFAQAGLAPGGDEGTYFGRYPVRQTVLDDRSARVEVRGGPTWAFLRDFRYAGGGGSGRPVGTRTGPVVVVRGTQPDSQQVEAMRLSGKVVIYLMPRDTAGRVAQQGWRTVFTLARGGPAAILVPASRSDTAWARVTAERDELKPAAFAAWPVWMDSVKEAGESRGEIVRFLPFLEVRDAALLPLLARHGIDAVAAGREGGPRAEPLPALELAIHFDRRTESVEWPANVIGILPGSDPALRHEHVVLTAHLDGLGLALGGGSEAERILNGADDNASGTAAVLEVARALASSNVRPRRSIVFAVVSGEERGLWGSDWLSGRPPVPASQIVANLNADMIGRAPGSSLVYVFGMDASPLGAHLRGVLAAHPELRLRTGGEAVVEARFPGQMLGRRSDHASFVRRGIPALAFFTGLHDDYHAPGDDADRVDHDAVARIARLLLYTTLSVADAPPSGGTR